MTVINLTGNVVGRLKVIKCVGKNKHGSALWKCKCSCGTVKVIDGQNLRTPNRTVSCGCWRSEQLDKGRRDLVKKQTIHSKSKTREHHIWQNMIYRCHTTTCPQYSGYGGRGIKVCKRWRSAFQNFLDDMGPAPSPKHTIDRIDNDGDYKPSNCRWATRKQQSRNRSSNRLLTYNGKTQSVSEWAEEYKLTNKYLLFDRLNRGWSIKEALTTPPDVTKRRNLID